VARKHKIPQASFTLRLPIDVAAVAQERARADGRPIGNFLRKLVTDALGEPRNKVAPVLLEELTALAARVQPRPRGPSVEAVAPEPLNNQPSLTTGNGGAGSRLRSNIDNGFQP